MKYPEKRKKELPDLKNGVSGSLLSKLFRKLLFDLGLTIERYKYFTRRFIEENNVDNSYKLNSLINIVAKEVTSEHMTWKTFLKSLVLIRTKKLTIYLIVEDKTISHEVNIRRKNLISELFPFNEQKSAKEDLANKELKTLFIKILDGVRPDHNVKSYIDEYVNTFYEGSSSVRGNTVKELKKDGITFKVFIKGLLIHKIFSFHIGVKLLTTNNRKYTTSFPVYLDSTPED